MSKPNYTALPEALKDLKERGYTENFNLRPYCLEYERSQLELGACEFEIDEVHRFERNSKSVKGPVVYVITTNKGIKGVLLDTIGVADCTVTDEMARKLKIDFKE